MTTLPLDMTVQGVPETLGKLNALGGTPGRRAVRKAVNAGGTPFVKAARRNVRQHKRSGDLGRAITKKSKSYARRGVFLVMIGARDRKTAEGNNPAKYLHLLEGGAAPHRIPGILSFAASGRQVIVRGVDHPGFPGRRPIEKAFQSSRREAERVFRDKLAKEVDVEVRKAARAGGHHIVGGSS